MRQKETPFLMAVTAAIISLFLAQIAAPTQFKPLTNHLLDYPGTLPAIRFENGIYRSTTDSRSLTLPLINQTKLKLLSYLPQTPQIAKVWVWGEAKAERESKQVKGGYAAQIAGNQAAAEAVYQQNLADKKTAADTAAGIPAQPVEPTTPPKPSATWDGACTQSIAYCTQYGNEVGRLGYVDPKSTDNVPAGFYRVADGTLRVLAIGATQTAYNQNAQVVASQIGAIPKDNLLKTSGTTNLDDAIKAYLLANSVIDADNQNAIISNYKENQKLIEEATIANDEVIKKLNNFLSPTTTITSLTGCNSPENCAQIDLHAYLRGLGLSEEDVIKYFNERQTNVVAYQKDMSLVKVYSDPLETPYALAQKVCNASPDCVKYFSSFKREDYLQDLNYEEMVAVAKTEYQINLINLTTLKDTLSFASLPVSTQNAITKVNTDITHAFAAYSFDQNKTDPITGKGKIVTVESSNEMAIKFGEMLKNDPTALDTWLADYSQHKDLYAGLIKASGLFNYLVTEKNPVVIAQIAQLAKTATIKGLALNGATLPYNQISETYKNEMRLLACKNDASLQTVCGHYKNATNNHDQLAAELDSKIADKDAYLLQVFNKYTGADILLSSSFSNVATLDNPLVDAKLKQAALSSLNTGSGFGVTNKAIDPKNLTLTETLKANEYLDRQLVTETYKIGGGIAIGTAGFLGGMAVGAGICAATVFGAPASPVCAIVGGVVGGISSVLATQVPLYEMTASEYAAQRGGDSLGASVYQSLYSNQGAWGDEGMGRSITTRDNQFALYSALNYTLNGQTLTSIQDSPELRTEMAVQGLVLNQWEENQNRQELWTYVSLPIAGITGGLNVGAGTSIASAFAGRTIKNGVGALITTNAARSVPMFVGSGVVNQLQTLVQFNTTGGDTSLLTTPEQVAYQVCVMNKGSEGCGSEAKSMNDSVAANLKFTMEQAFVTDTLTQIGQTATGFFSAYREYGSIISTAKDMNIETGSRPISDIQADIQLKNNAVLAANPVVNPADVAALDANTQKIIIAQNKQNSTAANFNVALEVVAQNNLKPTEVSKGIFRVQAPENTPADSPIHQAVARLNLLAEAIEVANGGNRLTQEQATILYTNYADIATAIKAVTPGGGKTSYITLILLAEAKKAIYSAANATDAREALNTMLKTEAGREYAKKHLGEVYYVEEDGTIYRVNLDEANFDQSNIKTGTRVTPGEFDARLANKDSTISIFSSQNGLGWESQKGGWGQKILEGKYEGIKFHIVADEAAKTAKASLAISGDPELITKSKQGRSAITTLDELLKKPSIKSLIEDQLDSNKPNLIAKVKNKESFTIDSPLKKTQVLKDIVSGAIAQIDSEQKSILKRLFGEKPNAKDLADLRALSVKMDKAIASQDGNLLSEVQGEFDTFIKRTGNSVVDAAGTRHALVSDIIDQLGLTENDFGLSKDGKTFLLREAKGESGKTYSSVGQQLVLYEVGKLMLAARGVKISNLPPVTDLTISITKSQTTLNAWYLKNYRSGNTITFLDGTGEVLVHMGLGGMQGSVVDLPIGSARSQSNYGSETDFVTEFNKRLAEDPGKAHKIVLGDTQLGFDSITDQIRASNPKRETLIAQYSLYDEEFIHYYTDDKGNEVRLPLKTKAEFEAKLHDLATNKPNETLIIIQGRDRALDISVQIDSLDIVSHSNIPRESIGTTSIQDAATQNVYRDRVFVPRVREDLISKVAEARKISREAAATLVDNAKKYHLYTHESLGINDVDQVVPVLAAQHAEHLNNVRLDNTLTILGDSQKDAITVLQSHGGDIGLAENKTFQSFIEAGLSEGNRLQEVYKRETASKPVIGAEEIALEIFTRGNREHERLTALFGEVKTKFDLTDPQLEQLAREWGVDQKYPSFETFKAKLSEATTGITPRDFKGKPMSTPIDEVLYWATNSSTNESSPAKYRVPTEAYIQSTVPKTTQVAPSTATTTPVADTPIARSPIFTELAKSLQSMNAGLLSLSLAAFTPNVVTAHHLGDQSLEEVLSSSDFTSLSLEFDGKVIVILKSKDGFYFQADENSDLETITSTAEVVKRLPPAVQVTKITHNGEDKDPSTYQSPITNTNPVTSLITATKDVVEDALDKSPKIISNYFPELLTEQSFDFTPDLVKQIESTISTIGLGETIVINDRYKITHFVANNPGYISKSEMSKKIFKLTDNKTEQSYILKVRTLITIDNSDQKTEITEEDNYQSLTAEVKNKNLINPIVYVSPNKTFYLTPFIENGLEYDNLINSISTDEYSVLVSELLIRLAEENVELIDVKFSIGHNVMLIRENNSNKLILFDHGSYIKSKQSTRNILTTILGREMINQSLGLTSQTIELLNAHLQSNVNRVIPSSAFYSQTPSPTNPSNSLITSAEKAIEKIADTLSPTPLLPQSPASNTQTNPIQQAQNFGAILARPFISTNNQANPNSRQPRVSIASGARQQIQQLLNQGKSTENIVNIDPAPILLPVPNNDTPSMIALDVETPEQTLSKDGGEYTGKDGIVYMNIDGQILTSDGDIITVEQAIERISASFSPILIEPTIKQNLSNKLLITTFDLTRRLANSLNITTPTDARLALETPELILQLTATSSKTKEVDQILKQNLADTARVSISQLVNNFLDPLEGLNLIKGNEAVNSAVLEAINQLDNLGFEIRTSQNGVPQTASSFIKELTSNTTQDSLAQITNPTTLKDISTILNNLSNLMRAYALSAREGQIAQIEADLLTNKVLLLTVSDSLVPTADQINQKEQDLIVTQQKLAQDEVEAEAKAQIEKAQQITLFNTIRTFLRNSGDKIALARLVASTLGTSNISQWGDAFSKLASLESDTEFIGVDWNTTNLKTELTTFYANKILALLPTISNARRITFTNYLWLNIESVVSAKQAEFKKKQTPVLTPEELTQLATISYYEKYLGHKLTLGINSQLMPEMDSKETNANLIDNARREAIQKIIQTEQKSSIQAQIKRIISLIESGLKENENYLSQNNRSQLFDREILKNLEGYSLRNYLDTNFAFDRQLQTSLLSAIKNDFEAKASLTIQAYVSNKQKTAQSAATEKARLERVVNEENRILKAGTLASFVYNRYDYYQFDLVENLARKILGVNINSTQNEIKKAFRDKALILAPDVNSRPKAQIIFQAINDAYKILQTYKDRKPYKTIVVQGNEIIETTEISAMRELFDQKNTPKQSTQQNNSRNQTSWPNDIVVGKGDNANIRVDNASTTMSRRHFSIGKDKNGYYVIDLNSSNGTYVNGKRSMSGKKTYINPGDKIGAGDVFTIISTNDGLDLFHGISNTTFHFSANSGNSRSTRTQRKSRSECSFCSTAIPNPIKAVLATTNIAKINLIILNNHNNHNFGRSDLQNIVNAVLFTRKANLTNNKNYYTRALSYLSLARIELETARSQIIAGDTTLGLTQDDLQAFDQTIRQLLLQIPISNTIAAGDIDGYFSIMDTAKTYLETMRESANGSNLRPSDVLVATPILATNRIIGDVLGRGESYNGLANIYDYIDNKKIIFLKSLNDRYSSVASTIKRLTNNHKQYPYYDRLKQSSALSPDAQVFLIQKIYPNIASQEPVIIAKYLLNNLPNLAPLNPKLYWELFYKIVDKRFLVEGSLVNDDLINFLSKPANIQHFHQLLDYIWDYTNKDILSNELISLLNPSSLHSADRIAYFKSIFNYYNDTKLDFNQIRKIGLPNLLSLDITQLQPTHLTEENIATYNKYIEQIKNIHQLVLTDNPLAIKQIRKYLKEIDPALEQQIARVIQTLSASESDELTKSYLRLGIGNGTIIIPGYTSDVLPYTWAIFAEQALANALSRDLIPAQALENILKFQNQEMLNFWTQVVPQLGIQVPKDYRGHQFRGDDIYFVFAKKDKPFVGADASGLIALLNYRDPTKLQLHLHHEANHQYIPLQGHAEIAIELLAEMIFRSVNPDISFILPPHNYGYSGYREGVNELIDIITELNTHYSEKESNYGTKAYLQGIIASSQSLESDEELIDPLDILLKEYNSAFPEKETAESRLQKYTDAEYYKPDRVNESPDQITAQDLPITKSADTGCSLCKVVLEKVASLAKKGTTPALISSLFELNNHTYTQQHIQDTYAAGIHYLLRDYKSSLSSLQKAQSKLTDEVKVQLKRGGEEIQAPLPETLNPIMQTVVSAVPITGTPTGDKIDEYNAAMEAAIAHVQGKVAETPLSSRLLSGMLSPILSLNRFIGDRTGQGETKQVAPINQSTSNIPSKDEIINMLVSNPDISGVRTILTAPTESNLTYTNASSFNNQQPDTEDNIGLEQTVQARKFKNTEGNQVSTNYFLPTAGRSTFKFINTPLKDKSGVRFPIIQRKGVGAVAEPLAFEDQGKLYGAPLNKSPEKYPTIGLTGEPAFINDNAVTLLWELNGLPVRKPYNAFALKGVFNGQYFEAMPSSLPGVSGQPIIANYASRNPYTMEDLIKILNTNQGNSKSEIQSKLTSRMDTFLQAQSYFLSFSNDKEAQAVASKLSENQSANSHVWINYVSNQFGQLLARKTSAGLLSGELHRQNIGFLEFRDLSDNPNYPDLNKYKLNPIPLSKLNQKNSSEQEYLNVLAEEIALVLDSIVETNGIINLAYSQPVNHNLDILIQNFIQGIIRDNPKNSNKIIDLLISRRDRFADNRIVGELYGNSTVFFNNWRTSIFQDGVNYPLPLIERRIVAELKTERILSKFTFLSASTKIKIHDLLFNFYYSQKKSLDRIIYPGSESTESIQVNTIFVKDFINHFGGKRNLITTIFREALKTPTVDYSKMKAIVDSLMTDLENNSILDKTAITPNASIGLIHELIGRELDIELLTERLVAMSQDAMYIQNTNLVLNYDYSNPLPLLAPAALGGGTTIGTAIINAAYNATMSGLQFLATNYYAFLPDINPGNINTLILNAKLWITTLYPSLSNFSLVTWTDSIIPKNFRVMPFGMSVVVPTAHTDSVNNKSEQASLDTIVQTRSETKVIEAIAIHTKNWFQTLLGGG